MRGMQLLKPAKKPTGYGDPIPQNANCLDQKSKGSGGIGTLGADGGRSLNAERHLAELQRSVVSLYRSGDYAAALEAARHARAESADYFGKGHPVVASSWNNVALMHKMLGEYDDAVQAFFSGRRNAPRVVLGHVSERVLD